MSALPAIGDVRTGCLCCPPKPAVAPLDWNPHPGFGNPYAKTVDGRPYRFTAPVPPSEQTRSRALKRAFKGIA